MPPELADLLHVIAKKPGLSTRRGASVLVSSVKERVPDDGSASRTSHANALVGRSTYGRRGLGQLTPVAPLPQSIYREFTHFAGGNIPTSKQHIVAKAYWIYPLRQRVYCFRSIAPNSKFRIRYAPIPSWPLCWQLVPEIFVLNVAIASDLPFLWIIARMFLNARYLNGLTEIANTLQ